MKDELRRALAPYGCDEGTINAMVEDAFAALSSSPVEEAPADVAETVAGYSLEGSAYENMEAAISKGDRTIAHFLRYSDAVELLALITRLSADLAALEAENFQLAAGQCIVERGLIGDEHGHFYCSVSADLAEARRVIEAYRSGCTNDECEYCERADQWLSQQGDQS